jgi:DNA polymerase-1
MTQFAVIDLDILLNASVWGQDTMEEAQDRFQQMVQSFVTETYADDWIGVLEPSGGGFREAIYDQYKINASRTASRDNRPDWFSDLKEWISTDFSPFNVLVAEEGNEGDDVMAQLCSYFRAKGKSYVAVTPDKDHLQIPGMLLSRAPVKYLGKDPTEIVHEITPKEAFYFFCYQMLVGDPVDNIPGIRGLGPVKVGEILNPEEDPEVWRDKVLETYQEKYGEDEWRD